MSLIVVSPGGSDQQGGASTPGGGGGSDPKPPAGVSVTVDADGNIVAVFEPVVRSYQTLPLRWGSLAHPWVAAASRLNLLKMGASSDVARLKSTEV